MKKLIIICPFLLLGCGPSREETEKRQREGLSSNEIPIYSGSNLRVVKIDQCEYVLYLGYTIIHKADCKNHINK